MWQIEIEMKFNQHCTTHLVANEVNLREQSQGMSRLKTNNFY